MAPPSRPSPKPPSTILIVGGGAFGLSTAYWLTKPGGPYHSKEYSSLITILDRSSNPPSEDAASYDLNKVVRSDYGSPFYAELMAKAFEIWKGKEEAYEGWKKWYHETGIVVCTSGDPTPLQTSLATQLQLSNSSSTSPASVASLSTKLSQALSFSTPSESSTETSSAAEVFRSPHSEAPPIVEASTSAAKAAASSPPRPLDNLEDAKRQFQTNTGPGIHPGHAYYNPVAGWANASGATGFLREEVKKQGVKFRTGKANGLVFKDSDDDVEGVTLEGSDEVLKADIIILASGAWTTTIFPTLNSKSSKESGGAPMIQSTGQIIGMIQLTDPTEISLYSRNPVVADYTTGFYIIPPGTDDLPNEDPKSNGDGNRGIIKFATHGSGWLNPEHGGEPRTKLGSGGGKEGDQIPEESVRELRRMVGRIYPDLGEREWLDSRLCWYTDSPDSDFIIDWHPTLRSLFVATGGSGHAFKFTPIIGSVVLDTLLSTVAPHIKERFSLTHERKAGKDASRIKDPGVLKEEEMAKKGKGVMKGVEKK